MFVQAFTLDGGIHLALFAVGYLRTDAMHFQGVVAKLEVVVLVVVTFVAPIVGRRQALAHALASTAEVVDAHIQVDVAKLAQVRIGIEQRQREALEHYRFHIGVAQGLHRHLQDLLQLELRHQIGAHLRLHHAKHFLRRLVATRHQRGRTAHQDVGGMVLGQPQHRLPIDFLIDGNGGSPQGSPHQGEILFLCR